MSDLLACSFSSTLLLVDNPLLFYTTPPTLAQPVRVARYLIDLVLQSPVPSTLSTLEPKLRAAPAIWFPITISGTKNCKCFWSNLLPHLPLHIEIHDFSQLVTSCFNLCSSLMRLFVDLYNEALFNTQRPRMGRQRKPLSRCTTGRDQQILSRGCDANNIMSCHAPQRPCLTTVSQPASQLARHFGICRPLPRLAFQLIKQPAPHESECRPRLRSWRTP